MKTTTVRIPVTTHKKLQRLRASTGITFFRMIDQMADRELAAIKADAARSAAEFELPIKGKHGFSLDAISKMRFASVCMDCAIVYPAELERCPYCHGTPAASVSRFPLPAARPVKQSSSHPQPATGGQGRKDSVSASAPQGSPRVADGSPVAREEISSAAAAADSSASSAPRGAAPLKKSRKLSGQNQKTPHPRHAAGGDAGNDPDSFVRGVPVCPDCHREFDSDLTECPFCAGGAQ